MKQLWLALSVFLLVICIWALAFRDGGSTESMDRDKDHSATMGSETPELTGIDSKGGLTVAPDVALSKARLWYLTGRVLGPGDQPVAGAEVRAKVRRGAVTTRLPSVRTDSTGRFQVDLRKIAAWPRLVRATSELRVHARADGYMPGSDKWVELGGRSPGTAIELDVQLAPGGRVCGRVVDTFGASVMAASVLLIPEPHPPGIRAYSLSTDDDGRYVFGVPKAGDYRLEADFEGGAVVSDTVTVAEGDNVRIPDLVVPGAAFAQGHVVLADGSPVPDVKIFRAVTGPPHMKYAGVTDAAGRFRIRVPEQGSHWIRVGRDPKRSGSAECNAGDRDVRISIDAARLAVRVLDSAGNPLPGATLQMMGWPPDDPHTLDALLTGELSSKDAEWKSCESSEDNVQSASGIVTTFVESGSSWHLVAYVPGAIPAEAALKIAADQLLAEVTLVIRDESPTGRLALELTAPDGTRVRDFTVDVESLSGVNLASLRSDKSGQLPSAPAGRVRLVIALEAGVPGGDPHHLSTFYLPERRIVDIPTQGTLSLQLSARKGGRFRLRVKFPRVLPRREPVSVTVRPIDDLLAPYRRVNEWVVIHGGKQTATNAFKLDAANVNAHLLEPGDYLLSLQTNAYGTHERNLRILPGEITDVVVDLPP